MHPADVVAAVRKRGSSLARLARENGLSHAAIRYSLKRPYLRAETALIDFLGVSPQTIWPERYDANGMRIIKRGRPTTSQTIVSNIAQRSRKGQ